MADETKTTTESMETNATETIANTSTPTVEELMEQLAKANADRDKYKSANDKLSKSEAEMKRQLRAKLTAEEQEAEAKAEAEQALKDELENLRKENDHNKAVNAYKAFDDETMVESLIDAVSDKDHNAIANIMTRFAQGEVKKMQAEWQKSRPRVNMGGDGALTKEQFENMSMTEKSKLYKENQAEYERLNS